MKLDLSKNQLSELPEYFGQLRALKHLDLYSNQLSRLPVGFCHLKSLKWLDLKGNPLVPALAKAAGPCITASDCAKCAKQVRTYVCTIEEVEEVVVALCLRDIRCHRLIDDWAIAAVESTFSLGHFVVFKHGF